MLFWFGVGLKGKLLDVVCCGIFLVCIFNGVEGMFIIVLMEDEILRFVDVLVVFYI